MKTKLRNAGVVFAIVMASLGAIAFFCFVIWLSGVIEWLAFAIFALIVLGILSVGAWSVAQHNGWLK